MIDIEQSQDVKIGKQAVRLGILSLLLKGGGQPFYLPVVKLPQRLNIL